ncbi:unannotated protein [freshwater metagenome]|jgi:hypothetical protein|uniref:Unannotated protein n=1 Tax=freshwater metagenome TaxID=449393 RepID=A0A6J7BXC4_9ZZZZ
MAAKIKARLVTDFDPGIVIVESIATARLEASIVGAGQFVIALILPVTITSVSHI